MRGGCQRTNFGEYDIRGKCESRTESERTKLTLLSRKRNRINAILNPRSIATNLPKFPRGHLLHTLEDIRRCVNEVDLFSRGGKGDAEVVGGVEECGREGRGEREGGEDERWGAGEGCVSGYC